MPEPIVFVDLETTGANFANDRIIEIGLVEVDVNGVREWTSLVNPGISIPPFISKLTGIDSTMVQSAPEFANLAPLLLEKLDKRLFIAHNARFDYNFLKREFQRLGLRFRAPNLCTVRLSRKLYPEHHRHSLDSLVTRFSIAVKERHRALADARVLWELWQIWHRDRPEDIVLQAIDTIIGRLSLPPQIDPELIDDLPESPGAYVMRGKDGGLLKTARSANLRQQVLAHFSQANRDTALARDTYSIEWRETAGDFGARLKELELSMEARKPLAELCSWQLVKHGEGDFRPHLVFACDLDFSTTPDLFGLYLSRREALLALRRLVEAQHLCHGLTGTGTTIPGEACVGFKQKNCRGACVGKEALSLHSARLMTALSKYRVVKWPYDGPVALVERDEFGMREDYHLVDRWRYLGSVQNESELHERLEQGKMEEFDPEAYRIINKTLRTGKIRVLPLSRA